MTSVLLSINTHRSTWILVVLSLISLESYRLWSQGFISTSEQGLLEVGQSIFLLLACLLHSYHSHTNKTDPLYRYLHAGLGLFCLALLLREFDMDKLGNQDNHWWRYVEWLVRGATLLGITAYAGKLLRHPNITLTRLTSLAATPAFGFTVWGACCYLCGWPFDESIFDLPPALSVWAEETLELNATILFFCAACTRSFHTDNSLLPNFIHDGRG